MANIRRKVNQYLWITLATSFFVLFLIISYLIHGYNTTLKVDQYKTQGEIFAEIIKTEPTQEKLSTYFNKLASRDDDAKFIYYSKSGHVVLNSSTNKPGALKISEFMGSDSDWVELESKGKERFILPIREGKILYGFLELEIKTSILNSHLRSLWILLLTFFIAIIFIIILILNRFSRNILDPVENVGATIRELANGNFKARANEELYQPTNELSKAINTLGENLQQIVKSYEVQQNRLITVIENMGSGLILIDAKGYLSLMNKAFIKQFGLKKDDVLGNLYHEVLPFEEMDALIKEIFLIEQNVRKQFVLTFPIERRHFEVNGAPILNNKQTLVGIVIVFHDITDIKKLEQMRKDFVANVSHELRTPVTSLKGFAETLLDGAMEDKETRERFLSIIWKESDRLQGLIQDLLELSKIEQDTFKLDLQPVNLKTILEDVILLLERKANEKGIELSSEVIGNPQIMNDSTRLKQIMINVINNSLTYTSSGGKCKVKIEERDEEVQFSVRDNGIGINKEEIPRIFERFYRIDKARSRNSGGTGLGLAIVKHLVDAMDGQIIVDSEKGKGTCFTIILKKQNTDGLR